MSRTVWIFNVTGEHQFFPHAVFSSRRLAEEWIVKVRFTGVLTKYFLNKPDNQDFPEHYHYEEDHDYAWLEEKIKK